MKIIVDTDALLGLFNTNDSLHRLSVLTAKKIATKKANIFILPTTLCEFALLASSRIGFKETQKAVELLAGSDYLTVELTEKETKEAVSLYHKQTSKEESLFDCFVMVAAKRIGADGIFSFDKGYVKNGLNLVSVRS